MNLSPLIVTTGLVCALTVAPWGAARAGSAPTQEGQGQGSWGQGSGEQGGWEEQLFPPLEDTSLASPLISPRDTALPAQVVAVQQTILSVEIPGKIDQLSLREGDRFTQGDVLIVIDCTIQQAHLDEARAASAAADTAARIHRRLQALNSASTLETQMAVAEAAQARAKLNSATALVSKCTVAAPFGGRVVTRRVRAHQYVQAGEPVLDILDDSALEVDFILPSAWIPQVSPGQAITMHVDETKGTYPATITRLGARVDPVSHSLSAVATLVGSAEGLLPGMTGQVHLRP